MPYVVAEKRQNRGKYRRWENLWKYKDIPYLLIEGWSRNRCFLLEDGTFYTEGSGGAMYRILENDVLDVNATQLSCKDYYFTKEKDESFEGVENYVADSSQPQVIAALYV